METNTATAVDAAPPASEPAPETTLLQSDTPPIASEQLEPVSDKPEWLPDKFWREGKADYEALAKSYQGMEHILGRKSQAVVIPNDKSTPEEIAEFRKALGIPEKPDDYVQALKPEQLPENIHFDDNLAKVASEIAHKHNIPPAAMKELAALQLQQQQAMVQASEQFVNQQLNAGKQELQQLYGEKFSEKIDTAKRVALTAGINPMARGFTDPEMVKLAIWAADQIAEDKLVAADASPNQVGYDRAMDIMKNPTNPLYQRYRDGDEDVVRQVREDLKSAFSKR